MSLELLPLLFFLIALFYSSVGFGGGSSYLALLSLFLGDFYEIRSTALILNICVVSIGTIAYLRNGILKPGIIWPFFVLSIPLAYLGARIQLSQGLFFINLGISLLLAAVSMCLRYWTAKPFNTEFSNSKKAILGGGIGLLSGISGIGGGIFLSPVLHLLQWKDARIIASLASVFILVNSIAGLVGFQTAGTLQVDLEMLLQLVIAVILGAIVGSYLSNKKLNLKVLGILTALLIFYVGLRLVLRYGFQIFI